MREDDAFRIVRVHHLRFREPRREILRSMSGRLPSRTKLLRLTAIASAICSVALARPAPSEAYADKGLFGCGGEVYWEFAGSGWSSGRQSDFEIGAELWDSGTEYTGQGFTTVYHLPLDYDVKTANLSGNLNGSTRCDPINRDIRIDNGVSGNQLRDVAAHEIGHALGFLHTGEGDSRDGRTPVMATCLTNGTTVRSFSQDDAGRLVEAFSSADTFHPNMGFEDGTKYWQFESGLSTLIRTDVAHSGYRSLGMKSSTAFSREGASQTVTLSLSPGQSIHARASLRRYSSDATNGLVYVQLATRTRNYSLPDPGDCALGSFPTGKDQNSVSGIGSYQTHSSNTYAPTGSWVNMDFAAHTLGSDDSYDTRINIESTVRTSGGDPREIDVDNARVMK